jgi:hypothetical protein
MKRLAGLSELALVAVAVLAPAHAARTRTARFDHWTRRHRSTLAREELAAARIGRFVRPGERSGAHRQATETPPVDRMLFEGLRRLTDAVVG